MATIGNTGTPNQTFGFYGLNASNNLAIHVVMPQAGQLTSLTCYMAGHGQTITARFCVWDNSGNLVAQTADQSIGAGSGGIGGQSFHTASLTSPYNAASGQGLYIGFWRHANQSDEWTEQNGGTEYQHTDSSNSAPGNIASWNTTGGQPSFYATYTPLNVPASIAFTPTVGPAGTVVAITGTGFTGATSVQFNGTSASFTVNSDTSITATAPVGATNGPISVTNAAGTGTSATSYTFSSVYADDGAVWDSVPVYADNGTSWVQIQVWADNGTSWVQIA